MYYEIGTLENIRVKDKIQSNIEFIREFTREEHDEYVEHSTYLLLHQKNKHLYQIIVRNGEELECYLETLEEKTMSEIQKEPDNVIFESNRLFMNYLSMIRSYLDHIPSTLSKVIGPQAKNEFNEFLSKVYDNYFEYRFIYRLRNLAQHFDLPINLLRTFQDCSYVKIGRDHILRYEKWSTVKKEIENMDEEIPVLGLATTMNLIMKLVYFCAMDLYAKGIEKAHKWVERLQKEFNSPECVLAVSNTIEDFKSKKFKIHQMRVQNFISSISDMNEHPRINIKIK
ncbi:hypothetical protein [Bacillus subtilis]|uniref:hypothetical protein n=1 Tax=Bacillus subtilis TaxID=1423 RepID=UPI000E2F5C2C|nr:hypothetical protein [Bacillus subtilis]MCB7161003.1 hypothetical protein [Bacillus subtilis]MCB7457999.1 hypothetical protein [Bacillus subtilis]CAF1802285.1 hypothetical protein NRS6148_00347 [Bacillus subtilis]